MKLPQIMAVIPFKGQIPLLLETVQSLFKSYISGFYWTLILWDDGSEREELDFLYNTLPKNITIVRNENVGYTRAVYNIIENMKAREDLKYVMLANSDLKFETGSFYALVHRMLSNINIGVVGGKILEYNGDTIIHTGTVVNKSRDGVDDPYCGLDRGNPLANNIERRLWANGSCCLYNLDVLRKHNLNFNLDFSPSYFEESDLQSQLNVLGHPILYEPRSNIHHFKNASHNADRDKYEKVFWANWDKYKSKWFSRFKEDIFDFGRK